ncbi:uncharacterized protein LOC132579280 [Heteronotia binoei]|uniref:uncharacterized protein LOC132579280 n=1 Tax=Heteronotia binoei TaxID=13085 RepID=UPI002930EA25|nr:uncharacterized protein LOC132579280 [Heteronotia binoei]
MEAGSFLAFQHDRTDLLAALEKQSHTGDFAQAPSAEKTPKGQDAETNPRQCPSHAHIEEVLPDRSDSEEIITYISENTTVTSADEEKLLLLNRNTELRRINKELMKLNQDWDYIYHSTSLGLQHRVRVLQEEVAALKLQAQSLSAKLEHEQNKREYYEQTLFQELKRSQSLQEYVRHLEGRQFPSPGRQAAPESQVSAPLPYEDFSASQHVLPTKSSKENIPSQCHTPAPAAYGRKPEECQCLAPQSVAGMAVAAEKEVSDLKDHLEALKCQTEIYEADYRTEQKDRQRIKAENAKLRQKEEEMRQQMALLEEQLKIFEDDFRKERSDKQVLQRLLKRKPEAKKPVPPHHCRGQEKPSNGSCSCSCHSKNHHHQ